MSGEGDGRLHEVANGPAVRSHPGVPLVRLAVASGRRRIWVECIDLAGPAVHEEKDPVFGLRWKVRVLRGQRLGLPRLGDQQVSPYFFPSPPVTHASIHSAVPHKQIPITPLSAGAGE
jgi:hypothetical protein